MGVVNSDGLSSSGRYDILDTNGNKIGEIDINGMVYDDQGNEIDLCVGEIAYSEEGKLIGECTIVDDGRAVETDDPAPVEDKPVDNQAATVPAPVPAECCEQQNECCDKPPTPTLDTVKPVINITGGTTTMTVGGTYTPPTVTAMDNVDGDITSSVVKSGDTVNPNVIASYIEKYDVMDEAGNPAVQGTHTVVVSAEADTEAPVLTITEHTVSDTDVLGIVTVDHSAHVSDNVTLDENLRIVVTTPNPEVSVTNVGASVTFERISGGAGDEVVGFQFEDEAGNLSVELMETIQPLHTK